jgi:hypothetical protein
MGQAYTGAMKNVWNAIEPMASSFLALIFIFTRQLPFTVRRLLQV